MRSRGPDLPAPNIESWHAEMAGFLKSIDPNSHLVSTHFSHPERGEGTLAVPEIDIATSNAYSAFDNLANGSCDAGAALLDFWKGNDDGTIRGFHIFAKPALVEEQGRHWMGMDGGRETNTKSQLDADLHAGLWGSIAVPLSGATGYWWWLHVHFDNRYFEYHALAKFMEGEDFRPIGNEPPLKPVFRSLGKTALLGRAMKSDRRMYVWIYHQATPLGDEEPPEVTNAVMNVGGLAPGKYRIEFWDTYKGEVSSAQDIDFKKDQVNAEIKLPPVKRDSAHEGQARLGMNGEDIFNREYSTALRHVGVKLDQLADSIVGRFCGGIAAIVDRDQHREVFPGRNPHVAKPRRVRSRVR